jgi:hypothetical protein
VPGLLEEPLFLLRSLERQDGGRKAIFHVAEMILAIAEMVLCVAEIILATVEMVS